MPNRPAKLSSSSLLTTKKPPQKRQRTFSLSSQDCSQHSTKSQEERQLETDLFPVPKPL